MDIAFEHLLILVVAAVALLLRFLRSRPPEEGEDAVSSRPTPAPYFPEEEVEAWPPPSRPVEAALPAHWPIRTMPEASRPEPSRWLPPEPAPQPPPEPAPPVPASAASLVPPVAIRPRSPWLAPVARDRNGLRRAVVLLTVLGPPRALAPFADHATADVRR